MATGQTTKTIFARRGYASDKWGHTFPVTFLAADRADLRARGWVRGWFEEGHVLSDHGDLTGHALFHVYEPSWRCSEPQRLPMKAAA